MANRVRGSLRAAPNRDHLATQPLSATGIRNTTGSRAGRLALPAPQTSDHASATPLTQADR